MIHLVLSSPVGGHDTSNLKFTRSSDAGPVLAPLNIGAYVE